MIANGWIIGSFTYYILRNTNTNQRIGNFNPPSPPLAKLQNFLEFQSFGIDINLYGGSKNTVLC